MEQVRYLIGLLLVAAVATATTAETELVLEDGQVLVGVQVSKEGDQYVLELVSGKLLSIPVDLVTEVRLVEDKAEPPDGLTPAAPKQLAGDEPAEPNGMRVEGPRTLVGEEVLPPDRGQQLEVLGPPSRFRPGLIDPEWVPTSDWKDDPSRVNFNPSTWARSIVDPRWTPVSAYEDMDVLAPGESDWRASLVDPKWVPIDGFGEKRAGWVSAEARGETPPGAAAPPPAKVTAQPETRKAPSSVSATRPSGSTRTSTQRYAIYNSGKAQRSPVRFSFTPAVRATPVEPAECAERLFAGAGGESSPEQAAAVPAAARPRPDVRAIVDGRTLALPIQLHEATLGATRAVFTVDGGECRLINGDLEALIGGNSTRDAAAVYAISAYNDALEDVGPVEPAGDRDRISYAFSIVSLLDSGVAGHRRADLILLESAGRAGAIAAGRPEACALSVAARSVQAGKAVEGFEPPRVTDDAGGYVVSFRSWSDLEGLVTRHVVRLSADGRVASAEREVVARHVGDHEDR